MSHWCQVYEAPEWEWKPQWLILDSINNIFSSHFWKHVDFKPKSVSGEFPLPSGSIPFETFNAQFSPYWGHKTTSYLFICEHICTFLFSSSLHSSFLTQDFPNYPTVLKNTNLIEQKNQCSIMLLGLLYFS